MKYPKKNKGRIKMPFENERGSWNTGYLNADGTMERSSISDFETAKQAWVCCHAHNDRLKFSRSKVLKIIELFSNGQKKQKAKKAKKQKNLRSNNKASSGYKKRLFASRWSQQRKKKVGNH